MLKNLQLWTEIINIVRIIINKKERENKMALDTAGSGYAYIDGDSKDPLYRSETPQTSLLNSLRLILETVSNQEERKIERIKFNYEEKIKSIERELERVEASRREFVDILKLIPNDNLLFGHNDAISLRSFKKWIEEKLEDEKKVEPVPYVEDVIGTTIKKLEKENESLQLKLKHVKTNGTKTSKIFLPGKNKKLIALSKVKPVPQNGMLLNTVITIPDGYELDKVILKKI